MKYPLEFLALVVFAALLTGCKSEQSTPVAGPEADSDAPIVMDEMPPMLDDAHGHPEHGPHGGDLVELGKDDFHAELVHGDTGIAMYVLDGSATSQIPISSEKLVISLKHDGQIATFELTANPDANDPPGQSSRYVSTDAKLDTWLDAGAEGAVVIEINGKSYTGKVAHDHDHSGHDHAGHNH